MKDSKSIKIIYVDDEIFNLQLFSINFGNKYIIVTALSGDEGLDILTANEDAQIVISDMKMPGMNGIEFIKQAKASFPDKKYYILTGYEITGEIREAIDNGLIVRYFRKPFNITEICESIRTDTI